MAHLRLPFDGDRLRAWRERRGLSQTGLAALVGVTQGRISQLEAGRKPAPPLLLRLVTALDVEVDDLLTPSDEPAGSTGRKAS
ncbi:helix-turn-helix domain-containing protein [Streptosporangium saharense]|uniref:helix-turn-helix domain-containing protein n=1 Tax=Streptosporangium saharense TaxID=1706840 RepID=UPI003412177D